MKKLSIKQLVVAVLVAVPPLYLGWYLFVNSVDTPFYDQWEIVPIIEHLRSGNFIFNDFWHQHNEHRIFFPRMLMLTAALITHWNTRVELFISLTIACVTFSFLLYMLRDTLKQVRMKSPVLLPILLSVIWFSLIQWENWLWGWQIQWFLNVFGVVLSLFGIFRTIRQVSPANTSLIIVGAVIAQYSLGNGVLLWPLIVLAMLYLRLPKLHIGATALTGFITTCLYYLHYVDPGGGSPKSLALHQPLSYAKYLAIYYGRSLSYMQKLDPFLGILLVMALIGGATFLFVKHKHRFILALPWIVLGFYSLASGAITGLSRLGYGLNQAYSNRYTTISDLLLISVIILAVTNRDLIAQALKRTYLPITFITVVVLFVLIGSNFAHGHTQARGQVQLLKDIQQCTRQEQPYDVCLLTTYPNKAIVTQRLTYLKSIHWAGY